MRDKSTFPAMSLPYLYASEPPESDVAAIRQIRAASNAAIVAHDAKAVASFVEDEVRVTAGSGEAFKGRKSMQERLAQQFQRSSDLVYVRTPETIEISSAAPLAAERGKWIGRWTEAGRRVQLRGTYQAMWRKTDGRWLIRSELFVLLERVEIAE